MKRFFTLFTALFLMGSMMVVQATTYTPAGTPASVFTNEWTPNTPANDMVLSNGLYVFAKKSNFSQTSISFKVCKDHGWTTAYPSSNYGFTIPNGSKYLIITYNTSGNAVNAFAISSMTVAGDNGTLFGNTWTPSATANDMTLQNDGTYKFEKSGVALSAGTVNFKACANHAWTNAWPSSNYELSIPESGNYTITITFNPATLSVSASADLEEAVVVIPNIQLHSDIKNPSWETTANFDIAGNNETASLTLTGVTKGSYEFGVKIDGTWTSNGSAFTRANNSHAVVTGSGNCTFNADRNGDYTFTWTYATNTLEIGYPAIPAQSVTFNSLASEILKGSVINLANCVESSGIDEPTYRFYIKEKNGEYGDAINANYNFNANGEYVVKVEALEYGEPVADDESNVVVYQSYTFTNGSTIYVDFSAVSGDVKGVNYPKANEVGMDWDAIGAGTVKTVTFTTNVTWTTMVESFIKTEKNGWANQPFTVPGTGKNCVVVAADGASYTWGTYVPAPPTVEMKGGWDTWADAVVFAGDATSVSVTKHLAVGEYEFKIIVGGDWRGNGYTYNRDYTGAEGITTNGANMKITADVEDDYTFTWTYETNALNITFPALPDPDAFVAGSAAEIFGTTWDASAAANKMTWDESLSKFKKTYTVDKAYKSVGLKVVYDGSWYGVEGGEDNVKFSLSGAGEFTVLFDKTTHYVTLDGAIVGEEQFDFEYAAVAANGEGNWAHGEDWNAATTTNRMTEVAMDIWEISFDNVPAKECQLKFCFDGTWDHEFGGTFSAFGTESSTVYGNTSSTINFSSIAGSIITIRLDLSNFNFATKEGAKFTVTQEEPIAEIGGKFIINAKGDTAVFSRGNLQYKQSSDTWRCAPNQYEWKGTDNLQMGNAAYAGWVDLFCWSLGAENNYGATSAYLTTDYYNKAFVDWGSLFAGDWSTLSIDQWYYLLYSRANANESWGMAMIGDNLGMVLLPNGWTAPSGVTFVPGTIPTTNMWYDDDCLDPTHADEDHWRLNSDNLPANKFTLEQWAALEAAGAVFCPYGGRRSGGYGNHTNRQDQTVSNEYAYSYYENYYGAYWTSTVAKPAEGKAYWLPMICGGCDANHENWGRGSHGWWENGRYGHSVRLAHIIPRQYGVTYTAGEGEGTVPVDGAKYLDGAVITLAEATGLSKEGYRFAGWKFKGQVYNESYTVNNVLANEEIVFEAQWEVDCQTVRTDLTAGTYYTICYPKAMTDVQGATLWSFVGKDANFAYIEQETATTIEAGKPYIMYATASTVTAVLGDETNAPGANGAIHGTFSDLTQDQLNNYATVAGNDLYLVIGNQLRKATGYANDGITPLTGNSLPANRAFVVLGDIPAASAHMPAHVRAMPLHKDTATGMDELNASETPVKVMINGQMYILRGEKMYDATGRLVK